MTSRVAIAVLRTRAGLCGCAAVGAAVLTAVLAAQPWPAGARTVTPSATRIVTGRVAEFPLGCQGAQRGVTVVLEPLGWSMRTSLEDGSFRFEQVPPGDYRLRVDYCNPFGCWPEQAIAVGASDVHRVLCPVPGGATTPTPGPTPQRTGDLGTKQVTGRVYDGSQGTTAGIAGATIHYDRWATFDPDESGSVETDAGGGFAFPLFLHDSDRILLTASAPGFAPEERAFSGYELWIAPPVEIALLPLSGTLEIAPVGVVSLPCEGDGEVTITNTDPPGGEPLTITAILPSNSYSQGDYGTGFTWDLSHLALPVTLAPGERIAFPVHYSAAGQSFPSRLTVRLHSTARDGQNFGVPYRGDIAGCGPPTPTPTATPARTPSCAGDCDGNGAATIDELVRAVALALGHDVAPCANADLDANGTIVVNELVAAVVAAAEGCAMASAP